ncbi:hypothetical protein FXO37_17232 [Capsicum annuum]|nr:hypothetical protein FXO37_17232 [Capsicum annuum]
MGLLGDFKASSLTLNEVELPRMLTPRPVNKRKPYHSVNFVIAHDGFTLYDLVSYNSKHNDANGEGGNDGCNDNFSWNCGIEALDNPLPFELALEVELGSGIATCWMTLIGQLNRSVLPLVAEIVERPVVGVLLDSGLCVAGFVEPIPNKQLFLGDLGNSFAEL